MSPARTLRGEVTRGRGVAANHLNWDSVSAILGESVRPGTLNVLLRRPFRLNPATAIPVGPKKFVWPATLRGSRVWIYRWGHAPLHVVELVSPLALREEFGLEEGSPVDIHVEGGDLSRTTGLGALAWAIVWTGRRSWSYRHDRYYWTTHKWCVRLGATQHAPTLKSAAWRRLSRLPIVGRNAQNRDAGHAYEGDRFERIQPTSGLSKLQNLLNYSKMSGTSYSAARYPAGYHTLRIEDLEIAGQRDPEMRLELVPIELAGREVLDLGCNQGGMLLAAARRGATGVGIDHDPRLVNCANLIAPLAGHHHLRYFHFDLEQEPLDLIRDLIPSDRVDVVFMLAMAMWIDNWREVLMFAAEISDALLFETNGSDEEQAEQLEHLKRVFAEVQLLAARSDDDPNQKRRQLFWATQALIGGE